MLDFKKALVADDGLIDIHSCLWYHPAQLTTESLFLSREAEGPAL
jgi:hypothetical protein